MRYIKTTMRCIITIMIVILILILIGVMLFIGMFYEPYTTPEKIKEEFYNNYETVSKITKYFIEAPYSNISVYDVHYIYDDGSFGCWYAYDKDSHNGGFMAIENSDIVNELSNLFNQRKYQSVTKDGNMVCFQLWANLDEGRGFVYMAKGKPTMQYLTKLEKIESSWYYYETNSNNITERQTVE